MSTKLADGLEVKGLHLKNRFAPKKWVLRSQNEIRQQFIMFSKIINNLIL